MRWQTGLFLGACFMTLTALFLLMQEGGAPRISSQALAPPAASDGPFVNTPPAATIATVVHAPWDTLFVNSETTAVALAADLGSLALFRWRADLKSFESWRSGRLSHFNSLDLLHPGDTVWALSKGEAEYRFDVLPSATTVELEPGWNQIPWQGSEATPRAVAAILGVTRLFQFDGASQSFLSFDMAGPGPLNSLQRIVYGATIWVLAAEARSVELLPPLLGALPGPRAGRSTPLALSADGTRLYVTNIDPGTITIVDTDAREALVEIAVGSEPRGLALDPRGPRAYVSSFSDSTLQIVDLVDGTVLRSVGTGSSPYGLVLSPDAQWLYVALDGADAVVEYSTATMLPQRTFALEEHPRGLAISGDGTRLYVAHMFSGRVSVVDVAQGTVLDVVSTGTESSNAQALAIHPSGEKVYVPHSRSRVSNANLQFDTTVAPLVSVIDAAEITHLRSELIGIDAVDRPVNMPFAITFSTDGDRIYVVNAGSNDVSVIALTTGLGVAHIEVGKNPRGIVIDREQRLAFVVNTLSYDVSIIDLESQVVLGAIAVSASPFEADVQRGKEIFFTSATSDVARDQWVSCAACHFEGLHDQRTWQMRDGPRNTPPILGLSDTGPYHWLGDRVDLFDFQKTITDRQGGTGLSDKDNAALAAFLGSQPFEQSPLRTSDGGLTSSAQRGENLFFANGCSTCHAGVAFTDRLRHNVGTGDDERGGSAFDTPSLLGLHDTAPYFHDGSAETLQILLTMSDSMGVHGIAALAPQDIADIAAFLSSLP